MPDFTSPDGIVYPISTDPIAPLNAVFQDLAESTQSALDDVRIEFASEISDVRTEIKEILIEETAEKTSNYTLEIDDLNKVVAMNGTNLVLTVPDNASVAFPIGSVVNVYNLNSTRVDIVGAGGVTVRNAGELAEYGEVSLRKRAADEWVLAGNVS